MIGTVDGRQCRTQQGSADAFSFSPELSILIDMKGIEIVEVSAARVPTAAAIEAQSFPEDEACTLETLAFRQAKVGKFFLEGRLKESGGEEGEMVGFICGSCCLGEELSHESMSSHEPGAPTLCIHSVAVAPKFRRRGYATTLLKAYVERVAMTQPEIRRICLIAKANLLHMYASCGFSLKGPSPIVHGKDPWFEMQINLDDTEPRMLKFVQVDSFADKIFAGNPAAVFFTHNGGDADWMQKVAVEMNLSESCFLELQHEREDDDSAEADGPLYALRWFTPAGEVDLCGHATLAAAHAVWDEGRADPKLPIRFSTLSGLLTCRRDGAGEGWVEMDFPAEHVDARLPAGDEERMQILEALALRDADASFVGRGRVDVLAEVTPESLRSMKPDMHKLAAIESRGFIATCKGAEGGKSSFASGGGVADFESRFFAPRHGIDEDPVTGSAHCFLATYWSKKLGRNTMVGYQASPRGGTVRVTYIPSSDDASSGGDGQQRGNVIGNPGRVKLEGKAVTVLRGLLRR